MSEEQPGRRFSTGFLWGCLTPIIIVGVIFLAALLYAGYYFFEGYKSDASFQTVMAALQKNPAAQAALGSNIQLSGFPNYSFRYENGVHTAVYDFAVQGSKGTANIHAETTINGSTTTIDTLHLAMPDGRGYDLIGHSGPSSTVWLLPRTYSST